MRTATDPSRSLKKWSAFDSSAALWSAGGAPRDDRATRVDRDHDADDDERVPGSVDLDVRAARQPLDGAPGDEEAGEHEDRCLRQRGQVLGLAVPVLVPFVGGPRSDADGEEREERGDEVGAGVERLGKEAEAVRREPGRQLDRDRTTAAIRTRARCGAAESCTKRKRAVARSGREGR